MTSLAAPRVARLWHEEQARGLTIQVLVVVAVFASGTWLIGNVVANFAALDKTFGFSFLWRLPANYDINQTLIDYSNTDTHLRAAVVGLLNTLLVAVIGIVLATILGIVVGVMRLSGNWLVSRIAAVYVEFTRNTPVLLLILLWHGIVINAFPHPRQAADIGGLVFFTNRGILVPRPIFEPGFWIVVAAIGIGLAAVLLLRRRAVRRRETTGRETRWVLAGTLIFVALSTVAFFAAGMPVSFDVPELRGFNFGGGIALLPEFAALTWALAFYTSGFIAEIVRGGINAVDRGQTEAARALGLSEGRVLRLVVLPQALRVIIPPLTSEYLNLTKNSSLAIAIGYMDLVATLGGITLNQTGREMEAMILVMLIYLLISLAISLFMNWYNRRVRLVER
jgi:general L-amino acid transport system permease protein